MSDMTSSSGVGRDGHGEPTVNEQDWQGGRSRALATIERELLSVLLNAGYPYSHSAKIVRELRRRLDDSLLVEGLPW